MHRSRVQHGPCPPSDVLGQAKTQSRASCGDGRGRSQAGKGEGVFMNADAAHGLIDPSIDQCCGVLGLWVIVRACVR
jgi:hypothetical protein